jgi:uncharacterized protein
MQETVSSTSKKSLGGDILNYAIWMTTDCNLRCKYCYKGQDKPHMQLNRQKCNDILDYIRRDLKNHQDTELLIDFHGGEPFLRFEEMQYLVHNILKEYEGYKKVVFGTTTNATLVTEEILNFIVQYIPDITVSLDGTKQIHDFFRPFRNGSGSYDTVMENSFKILEQLPNIRVRMTYNAESVKYLAEGVIELIEKGYKIIVPAADLFDRNWNDGAIHEVKNQISIIKDYLKGNSEVTISICEAVSLTKKTTCKGGITGQNIYPDGSIYPCMMAGGVTEFQIGDIYKGLDMMLIENILLHNDESHPECLGCGLYTSCNGNRCKIINKMITGSYSYPSEVECEINHVLYQVNGFERK